MALDITSLDIECRDGGTAVKVWAKCRTPDDVDQIIAWLHLAKGVMVKWEKINAASSRPAKAKAGKNEDAQPRQVQGEPQVPVGTDGQRAS